MRVARAVACMFVAVVGIRLLAQAPQRLTFEVASVKSNKSVDPAANRGIGMPGNRFEATDLTLHELIAFGYGHPGIPFRRLLDDQIVGDQGWMTSDRFDVQASTGDDVVGTAAANERKLGMLRQLLADRFKLAVHHETRTAAIYVLALAHGSDKLGPGLRPSSIDCGALAAAARGGAPPTTSPAGSRPPCSAMIAFGPVTTLAGNGQPLSALGDLLSRLTDRAIVDQTGLSGPFDIDLRFDAEGLPGVAALVGAGRDIPHSDQTVSTLFTALDEQLGLKLTPSRGPVDVIIIDHAERPTED